MNRPEVIAAVKGLELPPGEYAVIGGGVLAAHNVRATADVDILVSPELFEKLAENPGWIRTSPDWAEGREFLNKEPFEACSRLKFGNYAPSTAEIIQRADLIEGVAFQRIADLIEFKAALGREKDLADIAALKQHV